MQCEKLSFLHYHTPLKLFKHYKLVKESQRSKHYTMQVSKQDVLIIAQPKTVHSTREVFIHGSEA